MPSNKKKKLFSLSSGKKGKKKQAVSKKKLYIIIAASVLLIACITVSLILILGNGQQSDDRVDFIPPPAPDIATPGAVPPVAAPPGSNPPAVAPPGAVDSNEAAPAPATTRPSGPVDAQEARVIAQEWLDLLPFWENTVLDRDFQNETADGKEFFRFFLINQDMYWFSVMVQKDTGDLFVKTEEDGENPGPPVVAPVDEWFNMAFGLGTPTAEMYEILRNQNVKIEVNLFMLDGGEVKISRGSNGKWILQDRGSRAVDVNPEFTLKDNILDISIPGAANVYRFDNEFSGTFGSEEFRWNYNIGQ